MRKKNSRRLPGDREAKISELAEVVSCKCSELIDPPKIALSENIKTSFGDYGDAFDGMLESKSGRFHIFCNLNRVDDRNSPRARFTIAHELGHYYIDEHRNALLAGCAPCHPSFCDYQSPYLVEIEADCFASVLLMPSSRFRKAAKNARKALPGVLDLASKFQTSITATAIRYLQMDLFPCVMIKWDSSGYSWKRLSYSAYEARLRKTIEDVDRLPRGCATSRILKGTETGMIEAGTTMAAWFPFIGGSSERNAIYHEQAISLGRFGALTFLFPD